MDQLLDDPTRVSAEDNVTKAVARMKMWQYAMRSGKPISVGINDVLFIPTKARCRDAFRQAEGKKALRLESMSEASFFETYNKLEDLFLRVIYKTLKDSPYSQTSDLSGRFAQAVFEAGLMPPCGDPVKDRLLQVIDEPNMKDFETIRGKVWEFAFSRLGMLFSKQQNDLPLSREQYVQASSGATFLNDVLAGVHGCYAMEVLNALELAGFDADDQDIILSIAPSDETVSKASTLEMS